MMKMSVLRGQFSHFSSTIKLTNVLMRGEMITCKRVYDDKNGEHEGYRV